MRYPATSRTSGQKALGLLVQLGSEDSAVTDDRRGADAQTRFENIIAYPHTRLANRSMPRSNR